MKRTNKKQWLRMAIVVPVLLGMTALAHADPRWHGFHGRHGGWSGRVYLNFGPYWDPFWGTPYYPRPYYYSPPVIVTPTPPPTTYVQPHQTQPEYYWYYCTSPKGYYPYVKECPQGWMKVVPQAPPR